VFALISSHIFIDFNEHASNPTKMLNPHFYSYYNIVYRDELKIELLHTRWKSCAL